LSDRTKLGAGRVVFVSSGLHRLASRNIAFETPPAVLPGDFDCWAAYAQSKFFNILSARGFALRHPDVHFYSASPGLIDTNVQKKVALAPDADFNHKLLGIIGRTVKKGAVRTLQVLTDPTYAHETGFHLDDYVPLPNHPEMTTDNVEWLMQLSDAHLQARRSKSE
jgi:NAD(P)-dependent dehydrogenase (short-subunit alcohol dehydrogenase family)